MRFIRGYLVWHDGHVGLPCCRAGLDKHPVQAVQARQEGQDIQDSLRRDGADT
jgi:hypothetical protein